MGRRYVLAVFFAALVLLAAAGCPLPGESDLIGTWVYTEPEFIETLSFGPCSFVMKEYEPGTTTGELRCSITDVDETLRHLELAVESGTGYWADAPRDAVLYMYYEIGGNALYFDWSGTGYPSSAPWGPYLKR